MTTTVPSVQTVNRNETGEKMRKVLICLVVVLTSLGLTAQTSSAQELPPNPSCTILSVDGVTVTAEIADMRPNSGGEITFFNGVYEYDEDGNLLPNPYSYLELANGIHEFTLIPGEWSVAFAEWTRADDGTPGFIIGWGCDQTTIVTEDAVAPAEALRDYLTDLLASGDISGRVYNQLITQLNQAEEAIESGSGNAASAHLNNLARRAGHKKSGLDTDQVTVIQSYVDDIASELG